MGIFSKKNNVKPWTKFAYENILQYLQYLVEVKKVPWGRLKFYDESTFKSRSARDQDLVWNPKGTVIRTTTEYFDLRDGETYSLSLMTTLSNDTVPIVFDLVEGTNSQFSFLEMITFLIAHGHLVDGDFLVVDNCAIHAGEDTSDVLFDLLDAAGVKLVFLPKYSPELNPCELIFGILKNYLRFNRGKDKFDKEILFALSLISRYTVMSAYFDCIWIDYLKENWVVQH